MRLLKGLDTDGPAGHMMTHQLSVSTMSTQVNLSKTSATVGVIVSENQTVIQMVHQPSDAGRIGHKRQKTVS